MKKLKITAAVMSAALLLCGCSSMLNREYSSVTPHENQYWENQDTDTLRAEDYQSLVNDLLTLVSDHSDSGIVRFYGYADEMTVSTELENACLEIKMEDPFGSYAVDYMTYTVESERTYYEASVAISYTHTTDELSDIVNATTSDAVPQLISECAAAGESSLVVHISYLSGDTQSLDSAAGTALEAAGITAEHSITYYPNSGAIGDTRIVEISWSAESTATDAPEE